MDKKLAELMTHLEQAKLYLSGLNATAQLHVTHGAPDVRSLPKYYFRENLAERGSVEHIIDTLTKE